MSVILNFDASNVEPFEGFAAVPAGWYNVIMDESEMKPTKDGSGSYLQCRFDIVDGQYKGQKLFTRFNLRNQNPVAVEIAYKQLSAIAHAIGILQVQDSSQLHNRPLKVKVRVRKDPNGQYEDSNEITSYKNINENVGEAFTFAAPAQIPPVQQFASPTQQYAAPAQQYVPPVQQQYTAPQQPVQQYTAQAQQAPVYTSPAAPQFDPNQQTWSPPTQSQPWANAPVATAPQQAQATMPVNGTPPSNSGQPAQMPASHSEPHSAQGANPPWMK